MQLFMVKQSASLLASRIRGPFGSHVPIVAVAMVAGVYRNDVCQVGLKRQWLIRSNDRRQRDLARSRNRKGLNYICMQASQEARHWLAEARTTCLQAGVLNPG